MANASADNDALGQWSHMSARIGVHSSLRTVHRCGRISHFGEYRVGTNPSTWRSIRQTHRKSLRPSRDADGQGREEHRSRVEAVRAAGISTSSRCACRGHGSFAVVRSVALLALAALTLGGGGCRDLARIFGTFGNRALSTPVLKASCRTSHFEGRNQEFSRYRAWYPLRSTNQPSDPLDSDPPRTGLQRKRASCERGTMAPASKLLEHPAYFEVDTSTPTSLKPRPESPPPD